MTLISRGSMFRGGDEGLQPVMLAGHPTSSLPSSSGCGLLTVVASVL